ncbi:MAG: acetyl-CoA carboxylase biotin carboxyl carrier protein subunit [Acidobacteriaceae bacterium]|nr:acetyl-CoA carboxylase biotin carboxyl carrier protein subunit [Acidobacteriaceae bacterium]
MILSIVLDGVRRQVEFVASAEGPQPCAVDGAAFTADACLLEGGVLSLVVDGRQYRCVLDGDSVIIDGQRHTFEVVDTRALASRPGAGGRFSGPCAVKAPMPGRIVRYLVKEGDEVREQQGIVIVEAMKMQNELRSPKAGRVTSIESQPGVVVKTGEVLAIIE